MIHSRKLIIESLIYHTRGNAKTFKVDTSFGMNKFTKPFDQSEIQLEPMKMQECIKKSPRLRDALTMACRPSLDLAWLDKDFVPKREYHNLASRMKWLGFPTTIHAIEKLSSHTGDSENRLSKSAETQQRKEEAMAAEERFQKMKKLIDAKHKGGDKEQPLRGPSV